MKRAAWALTSTLAPWANRSPSGVLRNTKVKRFCVEGMAAPSGAVNASMRFLDHCQDGVSADRSHALDLFQGLAHAFVAGGQEGVMGGLHLRLATPVHAHDVDPFDVVGREPVHPLRISGVPGRYDLIHDAPHLGRFIHMSKQLAPGGGCACKRSSRRACQYARLSMCSPPAPRTYNMG